MLMRRWSTACGLIVALFASVIGVGAHEPEDSCPISNLPDCCKKPQSAGSAPEVFRSKSKALLSTRETKPASTFPRRGPAKNQKTTEDEHLRSSMRIGYRW